MLRLFADENFPLKVVELLRDRGYDVQTTREIGQDLVGWPDSEALAYATSENRALITINRTCFRRLHRANSNHSGIVACTQNLNKVEFAACIDAVLRDVDDLAGQIVSVYRPWR